MRGGDLRGRLDLAGGQQRRVIHRHRLGWGEGEVVVGDRLAAIGGRGQLELPPPLRGRVRLRGQPGLDPLRGGLELPRRLPQRLPGARVLQLPEHRPHEALRRLRALLDAEQRQPAAAPPARRLPVLHRRPEVARRPTMRALVRLLVLMRVLPLRGALGVQVRRMLMPGAATTPQQVVHSARGHRDDPQQDPLRIKII